MAYLWRRPWAGVGVAIESCQLRPGATDKVFGPVWLGCDEPGLPRINGRPGDGTSLFELQARRIFALPIPPHPSKGLNVTVPGGLAHIAFDGVPDRPNERDRSDEGLHEAFVLLDRVKAVWARMREVEMARIDPATVWETLHRLWMGQTGVDDPEMDVIVRHAVALPTTLDTLGRAPRRVLRRTQQMIPLSRVQEVDRRAMTWLVRQPGDTNAERAGGRQRIRAVAREENLDTLENRVLRSYASLAATVSRDYDQRHRMATASGRIRLVRALQKQCRQLTLSLAERGVREAQADVAPNFVLQSNLGYRQIWDAWQELLRRERLLDDLWRWQARSWEEFCALAIVVALRSMPGARVVATSPLAYRLEQQQGHWIEHVNPLAVVYLPDQGTTVEVQYGPLDGRLRGFGAVIWLRFGSVDKSDILTRWAIWPLWHPVGGLDRSDLDAIPGLLRHGTQDKVRGGLTIRPASSLVAESERNGAAACVTLGASGDALLTGLHALRAVLTDVLAQKGP